MRMFPHKVRILGGSQHFVELLKAHSITNTQTYIATFTLIRRSTNPFHFVVKTRTCATTLNASSELFAYKTRSLHVRRHSAVRQSDIFNHKRGCYVPQNHYQWQVLSVGHLACPPIIRCVPACNTVKVAYRDGDSFIDMNLIKIIHDVYTVSSNRYKQSYCLMIIIILLNQSIALIRDCTLYSATNWILNIQQMRAEVSKYSKF